MGDKASAFAKGGLGCLGSLRQIGGLALIIGGTAHIDVGGAVLLFVIGGAIGLIVLWIYNMGKHSRGGPPK